MNIDCRSRNCSGYCAIVILCEDPLQISSPFAICGSLWWRLCYFLNRDIFIYVWVSFVSDEPSLPRAFEKTSPIGLVFPWTSGCYFAIVPICSHLWYRMDEYAIYINIRLRQYHEDGIGYQICIIKNTYICSRKGYIYIIRISFTQV